MQMQLAIQQEIQVKKIQVQQEMKNAKYLIWLQTYMNGPQNTALARLLAVKLTLVLIGAATTTIPATARVVVTSTMRLAASSPIFPSDLYFM